MDLFSASELSIALGITRKKFFAASPKREKRQIDHGYGKISAFAPGRLPLTLQVKLAALQEQELPYMPLDKLVRLKLQQHRVPAIRNLLEQRLAPHRKAHMRRRVMAWYFRAVDSGVPQKEAILRARANLLALGFESEERQIRRVAYQVHACGGPALAPIDSYGDLKSVPHKRTINRPHHGASAARAGARRPSQSQGAKPEDGTHGT